MKIYIATPVNGRSEATLEEKRQAAYKRVCELAVKIAKLMNMRIEVHSAFDEDIAPINVDLTRKMYGYKLPSEAVIMGKCVQRVMECDAILLDDGWMESKGCLLEHYAAFDYRKKIFRLENLEG